MEPEQYDYENSLGEDYSQDEWYYQNPHYTSNPEEDKLEDYMSGYDEDDEYDMDELPYDYMNEYEDGYYEPENEI